MTTNVSRQRRFLGRTVWINASLEKPARRWFCGRWQNWLDLVHALSLLGIDKEEAERLGITAYKVGQVWPVDMASFHEWAEGLDLIVVVEESES